MCLCKSLHVLSAPRNPLLNHRKLSLRKLRFSIKQLKTSNPQIPTNNKAPKSQLIQNRYNPKNKYFNKTIERALKEAV